MKKDITSQAPMEEMKWVDKINEEINNSGSSILDEIEKWNKHSIYKVPSQLKELNKNVYKPQKISFGPYHHGEEHLMAMEEYKHRALIRFLKKCKKPIELFVQRLDQVVHELRDSYLPLDPIWILDKSKFLQMMILDGCFILEILNPSNNSNNLLPYILRDMLILENQIPMTVLHTLLQVKNGDKGDNQLLLYTNFKFLFSVNILRPSYSMGEFMHVLDMFRKYVIPPPTEVEEMLPNALVVTEYRNISVSYRSAVELNEAGISFKKSKTSNFGDVSFKRGVLRLPLMILDENTQYIFHNLTAFESLHIGVGKEVTMFLLFMGSIINSAKDVSILCQSGILINAYGSYEDIAKLFNSLPKEIPVNESFGFGGGMSKVNDFSKMRSEIDDFCKKPWNKWRANLTQTYFRNPWSMVSLVAAIFLFALTSIQTGYSIAQFYQKPN